MIGSIEEGRDELDLLCTLEGEYIGSLDRSTLIICCGATHGGSSETVHHGALAPGSHDGSEASEDAVAFGLTWSRSTGDVPIIATVYPAEHALGIGRVDADWASYVREHAQIVQDNARITVGDAALYRNVASTSAAHGLVDLAEDVEAVMVIVRTTRETGLTRALLGSSTERLLHGATAPVTVVPPLWRQSAPAWISRIGVLIRRARLPVTVLPRATSVCAE
jgi:nucleotide-binding universal stress UspA family protein